MSDSSSSKDDSPSGAGERPASNEGAVQTGMPPQLHLALKEILTAIDGGLNIVASLGIRWSLEALFATNVGRVRGIERALVAAVGAGYISANERSLLSRAITIDQTSDALTLRAALSICERLASAPPVPPHTQRAETHLTRRQNVMAEAFLFSRSLLADGQSHRGLEAKFVAVIDIDASMFTGLKNGKRPIGDRLAARIELKLGKPPGWLSEVHVSEAMNADEAAMVSLVLDKYRRIDQGAQTRLRYLLSLD